MEHEVESKRIHVDAKLTKKLELNLKFLCDHHQTSRSDIIRRLIREEYLRVMKAEYPMMTRDEELKREL